MAAAGIDAMHASWDDSKARLHTDSHCSLGTDVQQHKQSKHLDERKLSCLMRAPLSACLYLPSPQDNVSCMPGHEPHCTVTIQIM
jgi:hypothetical protein